MKVSLSLIAYLVLGVSFLQQLGYILYYQDNSKETFVQLNSNPYSERKSNFYKVAIHLHSDEVFYTPERPSVNDIITSYSKHGYDLISISDYNQITYPLNQENYLISYEWGRNFRKRHILVVGTEIIPPSGFVISSFLPNVQMAINQVARENAFISINHPDLYEAFSKEDLLELKNYHAIEVFSPFGDKTEKWDYLLTNKGQVYCSSVDDLHYFHESLTRELKQSFWKNILQHVMFQRNRESEAFLRYIVINANNKTPNEIKTSLLNGNYFCIKKFNRILKDIQIPELVVKENFIQLKTNHPFLHVSFIVNEGRIAKEYKNTSTAEYQFQTKDKYVRILMITLEGMLLTNAMFLK